MRKLSITDQILNAEEMDDVMSPDLDLLIEEMDKVLAANELILNETLEYAVGTL